MNKVVLGHEIGPDIVRALGLQGLDVIGLTIKIYVGRPVTVEVEIRPDKKEMIEVKSVILDYKLMGKEAGE